MTNLEFFDFYVKQQHWNVIPVLPNSKKPFVKGWNKLYNYEEMRDRIIARPNSNLGLILGDIIDVEADTESANKLLTRLTYGCEHPMYISKLSIHHLFLSPDKDLTRVVINGIEFRGNLHQSLLPPSKIGGTTYNWINTANFKIPPLPKALNRLYLRHIQPDEILFRPQCNYCNRETNVMHRKRHKLEVKAFMSCGLKWQCHNCRQIDVRSICRKIRQGFVAAGL